MFQILIFVTTYALANGQQVITLGKKSITIPDSPIGVRDSKYFIDKSYIKYQHDSVFYYEVRQEKDDKNEYKKIDVYAFPVISIDGRSLSLDQTNVEPLLGKNYTYYTTRVWLAYPFYVENKVWHYSYDTKGKMKKDDLMYIFIQSDSREVFDKLKSLISF